MINDLGEPFDTRLQCLLAVLVEEELGIGQARAHDPLVAANHCTGIGRADVADHQELVGQLAGGVEQREVLLVGLHRQNQALLRHVEELRVELADQHVRTLDQTGDFVEQGLVHQHLVARPQALGGLRQLLHDGKAALLEAGNHRAVLLQRGGIAVGVRNHDR